MSGANFAANLAVGPWLDDILPKFNVELGGVVLISGVYSLIKPLGGSYSILNKGFDKMYRLRSYLFLAMFVMF